MRKSNSEMILECINYAKEQNETSGGEIMKDLDNETYELLVAKVNTVSSDLNHGNPMGLAVTVAHKKNMIDALHQLSAAFVAVDNVFNDPHLMTYLSDKYPFDSSFDELVTLVDEWSEDIIEALDHISSIV